MERGGKIGGVACRRSLCQEFNDNKKGKGERRGHSKLMLPGMACGARCNAYPCVAKLARAEFPACQVLRHYVILLCNIT